MPLRPRDKSVPAVEALWPPTLVTKSQKPRPERWPLTDPANGRRHVASLCATQPANGRRLVANLLLAFEVDRPHVASFLRKSPRRVDQVMWPARATVPEQSFGAPTVAAAPSSEELSAIPSVEIAAALASTMAQRAQSRHSRRSEQLRAKTACEAQARSEALGSR